MTQQHAQTVLGVILEQRVVPCRAVTVFVDGIGRCGCRVAPNRRAAGGVGDVHAVAEQLRNQTRIRRLGTAGARAGELEQRLVELAVLDRRTCELGLGGNLLDAVVEDGLLVELTLGGNHRERALGALADAHAAAHAVERRDGHRVLEALRLALALDELGSFGSGSSLFLGQSERTDRRVRADERTLVALDALISIPLGNEHSHAALLECGGARLPLAVNVIDECGNGQTVTVHAADGLHDVGNLLDEQFVALERTVGLLIDGVGP